MLIDFPLHLVDAGIPLRGPRGQIGVAPRNGVDGIGQLRLHGPAHLDDAVGQVLEVLVVGSNDMM